MTKIIMRIDSRKRTDFYWLQKEKCRLIAHERQFGNELRAKNEIK